MKLSSSVFKFLKPSEFKILYFLAQNPNVSYNEIVNATGLSRGTVENVMRTLMRIELIERDSITSKGGNYKILDNVTEEIQL
jgi:predicted transcriptional regulator